MTVELRKANDFQNRTIVAMSIQQYQEHKSKLPARASVAFINDVALNEIQTDDSLGGMPAATYVLTDKSGAIKMNWPLECREIPDAGFGGEKQFIAPTLVILHLDPSNALIMQVMSKNHLTGLIDFIDLLK